MQKIPVVVGTIFCLWTAIFYAQETAPYEDILESFETEEIDQIDFLQVLLDLEEHPIDINSATIRELLKIPFLNQQLAREIVRYRNKTGKYAAKSDLMNVPGISEELLSAISPLIQLQTPRYLPVIDYRLQLARPLHTIRGYEETLNPNHYENPLYLYQRLRWRPNRAFQAGFLWEKDIGESNWFDFGSFYFSYHWIKAKSHVLVGDFNLEIGQRLVFSNPYGAPLSLGTVYPFTQTPFRWNVKNGVDESAFLRGVLWNFSPSGRTTLTLGYSNHALDGSFNEDSSAINSISSSGYHRTVAEESKKHLFKETIFTFGVFKDLATEQIGLQASRVGYSFPIEIEEGNVKKDFTYVSGYYSSHRKLLHLQGEGALLNGKFPAFQQSILIKSPKPLINYGALVYYHHPNYWSFHGRSFGRSSSSPSNEIGYFLSINAKIFPRTEAAAYFHASRPIRPIEEFPFLDRSQQFQIIQDINNSRASLRFTQRTRKGSVAGLSNKFITLEQVSRILRFHIETHISKNLRLSHRIEASWVSPSPQLSKTHGVSFYQDIRYHVGKKFGIQIRWTQFEIPDYDYRLYEFENDLPGSFRNVLLNDRGFKWFALASWSIGRSWNIALKYREIYYPDEVTLGSGLDTVWGNRKQEIRVQAQIAY